MQYVEGLSSKRKGEGRAMVAARNAQQYAAAKLAMIA